MIQINSVDIATMPSDHDWGDRTTLGYDGNGSPIYTAPRTYEMSWEWVDASTLSQMITAFNGASGTSQQVTLPTWNSPTGGYSTYNAIFTEPTYKNSFMGNYGNVKWLLLNIK